MDVDGEHQIRYGGAAEESHAALPEATERLGEPL